MKDESLGTFKELIDEYLALLTHDDGEEWYCSYQYLGKQEMARFLEWLDRRLEWEEGKPVPVPITTEWWRRLL